MNSSDFLTLLCSVRPCGKGWIARCPAHEDHWPSLSICEGNGKILVHCFAGCSIDAICSAIGIEVRELFTARVRHRRKPSIVHSVEQQIKSLHRCLTPRDRERDITVVLAKRESLDPAIARALALAVDGELVQVALEERVNEHRTD
jgi:hypothetical protein